MPLVELAVYAEAVGRVHAGELLAAVVPAQLGSGVLKKPAQRRLIDQLERAARRGRKARPANPARLRAAGIAVEHVTTRPTDTRG